MLRKFAAAVKLFVYCIDAHRFSKYWKNVVGSCGYISAVAGGEGGVSDGAV